MQSKSSDEMDLIELAVKTFRFLQNHFWFFCLAGVIGSGMGLGLFFLTPKVFATKMVIQSKLLTEPLARQIIQSLNDLAKENNDDELSEKLGLPSQEAKKIRGFSVTSYEGQKANKNDEITEVTHIIELQVSDPATIPYIQKGLLVYLDNNPHLKSIRGQQRAYFTSLIQYINNELKSLDSLKVNLNSGNPVFGKNGNETMLLNPATVYTQVIELRKQQLDYQRDLQLSEGIQVLEDFIIFKSPIKPRLFVYLGVGFFVGIFGVIFILFFRWLLKTSQTYPQ
jgi:hypothetical protein